MKRRELLKIMKRIAKAHGTELVLDHEGRNHTIFVLAGHNIPVPRHAELGEGLARTIIRQAEAAVRQLREDD